MIFFKFQNLLKIAEKFYTRTEKKTLPLVCKNTIVIWCTNHFHVYLVFFANKDIIL